jgi:hypothetical protein
VPLFQDQPAARPRLVYRVDMSADSPSRSCEEPAWWYCPAAAQQYADSVDVAVAARSGAPPHASFRGLFALPRQAQTARNPTRGGVVDPVGTRPTKRKDFRPNHGLELPDFRGRLNAFGTRTFLVSSELLKCRRGVRVAEPPGITFRPS